MTDDAHVLDVVPTLTGFARALRAAGVAADRARLTTALEALGASSTARSADHVYWATRLALCAEPDDLPRFDALFDLWFRGMRPTVPTPRGPASPRSSIPSPRLGRNDADREQSGDDDVLRTAASEAEILRHRDVASSAPPSATRSTGSSRCWRRGSARRRTLRRSPRGSDRVDVRRTVRQLLKDGGEPGALRYTGRREKPRRLVLLLDVSGSMAPYADALLRFAHAAVRATRPRPRCSRSAPG